ncbi:hypothetical protein [Methylobacterium iners]|uniref:Uncharacterized protein n=1 Tax=Methylobacterium iners TaxID=418707 RepID=A0ABQ4RW99_9HYPH|nr:hypothetical protein [Methylobacterium iners]GJD94861.1 hypothetical protein OCOJLMKI_2068 [Methylobacterium iners]
MRATIFGIAAVALLGLAAPGQAAPLAFGQGFAPGSAVEQARVVRRTVVRGPRCKTVVTKRRGPLGRVTIVRKRSCF